MLSDAYRGEAKRRVIFYDEKVGPTRSSRRSERSLSLKVIGAAADVMELRVFAISANFNVGFGVLDLYDTFRFIPLSRRERRLFSSEVEMNFYAFLRTAQGSRGAPLTWSRFGAPLARRMQGVVGLCRGRLNPFVTDTFLALLSAPQGYIYIYRERERERELILFWCHTSGLRLGYCYICARLTSDNV